MADPNVYFFSVKMFATGHKVCQCAQGVCASNGVCMDNSFLGLGGPKSQSWSSRNPGNRSSQDFWAPTRTLMPIRTSTNSTNSTSHISSTSRQCKAGEVPQLDAINSVVCCILCFSCSIGGQQNSMPLPFFGRLYKAFRSL